MFSRLNQVARHLSRPLPNYLHQSAAAATSRLTSNPTIMAQANNKRTINTAACLIIGDEVLGGKVGQSLSFAHIVMSFASCSSYHDGDSEDMANTSELICCNARIREGIHR